MPEIFDKTKKWFDSYVAGFFTGDPENDLVIHLKQDHTYRVCDYATMLSKTLGWPDEDGLNARLTALLHDVGRFQQFALYRTFNDSVSENHAHLGLREIEYHRVLESLGQEQRRLICRAIAFHNVAMLPAHENPHDLMLMKLIRDADKLDIYQVIIANYREQSREAKNTILHNLPDTPHCSPKILDALTEKKVARFEHIKTLNDFKLLQIGWVYDLNYTPSFRIVHRNRYIEQLKAMLPRTESVISAVNQALAYVASRLQSDHDSRPEE